MKKITKQFWFKAVACLLASLLIRVVFYLSRVERHMPESTLPYLRGEKHAIFAFWHGRMMLMPMFKPKARKMHVMISHHSDGELIARTMHLFGFGTIRGSTSKGGATAASRAVKTLELGENVSITPDGPRGPNMVVAPGIIGIARMSGLPIIPVTFSTTRCKRARSWDRFMLALPFGRVAFVAGNPLTVAAGDDEEQARLVLEASMRHITEKADTFCGVT